MAACIGGAAMITGLLVTMVASANVGILLAWGGIAVGLAGLGLGFAARRAAR